MFYNIFSKEKLKEENKTEIIIDIHEKNSLVPSFLIQKKIPIKFERLDVADYLIGETAIERKTFSDFASSIIDKRIFNQLENMKKYEKKMLIIESFDFNYESFLHENALRGTILSISLNEKIPIIFTKDEKDTADFMEILSKKQSRKQEVSLRPPRVFKNLGEQKQFILEGFPGIGPMTAKKLLEQNKNLKEIFALTEEQLKEQKIRSLNEDKIKKFKSLLED